MYRTHAKGLVHSKHSVLRGQAWRTKCFRKTEQCDDSARFLFVYSKKKIAF